MKIKIIAKNFKVSDYLESIIEKKLSKLDKFLSDDASADVNISAERGKQILDITIFDHNIIYKAESFSSDIYSAVDIVLEKLESQHRKHKTRISAHKKDTIRMPEEIDKDVNMYQDMEEDFIPEVKKIKRFQIKPMSLDEAILQMQLLEHSFFVFTNADNGTVNVIYKRKDGDYGLIEPEYA